MAAVSIHQTNSFLQTISKENESVATSDCPQIQPFYQRAIVHLTSAQDKLDHLIPNSWMQNKIDSFIRKIEEAFQSSELQSRLEPAGNWKHELARFLAGLPKKVACNILNSLKNLVQMILQGSLYAVAHPMKAPMELAKKIILLVHDLSQPEAWVRIGANTMGSSLGYTLVAPNPISPIFLIIGAALSVAGISLIAIKAALDKTNPSISGKCLSQGKILVEEMTTGLCLGLLIGGIQRAVRQIKQWNQDISYERSVNQARMDAAKSQARDFVNLQNLPEYDRIRSGSNSISIYFDPKRHLSLPKELPNAATVYDEFVTKVKVLPGANGAFSLLETKTEMMGYEFPLQTWQAPPALPPVAAGLDIGNQVFLASAISTTARIKNGS